MRVPSDTPAPGRRRSAAARSNKGRIALIVVVGLVVLLFLSSQAIARFYTDYLWFDSLGRVDVFRGVLLNQILLAVVFTVAAAVLLVVNLAIADRLAPRERGSGPEEQLIARYRSLMRKRRWVLWLVVGIVFGVLAGVPVSSRWQEWLLFRNAVDFGVDDAQFGVDVGFYVFRLPFLSFVVDWLFAVTVVALLITTVSHYLNGGIRLQTGGRRVTAQVKLHLSVLLALLALLKAAAYWLDHYRLTTSQRGAVDGAAYTDVNAQLPATYLLILISILAAVLLIINVWQRGWRLPVIAVGLWAVVAAVAGTAYPSVLQRLYVEGRRSELERPYVQRNIEATRLAYGIDASTGLTRDAFAAGQVSADEVRSSTAGLAATRLLDPDRVIDTFRNTQTRERFYQFNSLDLDRYVIDGKLTPVVIGARELRVEGQESGWENRHLAYTAGYGVAIAPANRIGSDGRPAVLDPGAGGPKLDQPMIYFGENLPSYAIVGTRRAEGEKTLDTTQVVRYEGAGGVRLDSPVKRAAFALRFGEWNIFASGLITDTSRILHERDVRDRARTLAPFLAFDSNPYPVVVGGRVQWVIDAYTTTDRYPYAQQADTSDQPDRSDLRRPFNYVRNSVKAVVDAYEGSVAFYVSDPADPLVRAYQRAFPELFTPLTQAPAELTAHFRYPADLFHVQTTMWGRYHVDDPVRFLDGNLTWNPAQLVPFSQDGDRQAAATPAVTGGSILSSGRRPRTAPSWAVMQLPGPEAPEFVIWRSFELRDPNDARKELKAVMVASLDEAMRPRLRVLEMPDPSPDGPAIVDSDIRKTFAQELSLLDQRGSRVEFGALQAVPVGDGLVWVRPWFVRAEGGTQVPELQYVTVTVGKSSKRGRTLEEALQQAFAIDPGFTTVVASPGGSGGGAGGGGGTVTPTPTPTPTTATTVPSPATTMAPAGSVEELLAQADRLFQEAQRAYQQGDLTGWKQKLEAAYERAAQAASQAIGRPVAARPLTSPTTTVGA